MIHLYTRGLGTHIRGEAHLNLFKSYVNKYSQRAWDLYLHGGPWYFWEDLKKTFIFVYLFKEVKLIEIYTKMCTMKYLISCTGMGLIPMWRPVFYFHKTWLIVLFTDASFVVFENSLKVVFERSFLYKEKL